MSLKQEYEKFLKDIEGVPEEEKATMTPEEIAKKQVILEVCRKMMEADIPYLMIFEGPNTFNLSQWQRVLFSSDGESSPKGEEFASHFFGQICFGFYNYLTINLKAINVEPTYENVMEYFASGLIGAADYLNETV